MEDSSGFLYWRVGSFLFIILVLAFARCMLQRWYAAKLASALVAQQRELELQQRDRDDLARIEAEILRTAIRQSNIRAGIIVPSEPPPCDYETAIKCQTVKQAFVNIYIEDDEAPPTYKDYLEGVAAAAQNNPGLASGFGASAAPWVTKK